MYTINNIKKKKRFKKINLNCNLDIDEGQIYLFTGHDKNINELFDILGSFKTKYSGEFLYGLDEKTNILKDSSLLSEIVFSNFLQDYNSSMKVKKYLKYKKKYSNNFDEDFMQSVLKRFAIDDYARLENLKDDYCNIVLMAAALATNKRLVILKNFDISDKNLNLEFINILVERQKVIKNTIFVASDIVEDMFFDKIVIMNEGSIKFVDSKHNIISKANIIRGPKEIISKFNHKYILSKNTDGLEDEIKIFDNVSNDELSVLLNNGCVVDKIRIDEFITMIEEGNYGQSVKTEVVE